MSTATASRRPAGQRAEPGGRPSPRSVVRPVSDFAQSPARAPFVVLVLVILSLGLGSLLLLNTLLAQGSFALHSLDAKVAALTDREQALQQKSAELASPKRLARSAAALGMVPTVNPAFLRTEDGKVLGAPVPAASPPPVVGSETESASEKQAGDQAAKPDKSTQQAGSNDKGDGGADR